MTDTMISHSANFRTRRFLNWFPLGLSYALLYMGRYNLTVAKTSLGTLMTKEDFGIIFGVGTLIYALAFLFNGPLVDRMGGRKGMLVGLLGAGLANLGMAIYLHSVLDSADATTAPLRVVFSTLYGLNMYFQSFGAVSIVKVNSHWFHVRERGGFSGIFGTMISSGIFLAFTVNGWLLDFASSMWPGQKMQWVVFLAPAILLLAFLVIEFFLLRDQPSHAGHQDFDTGDASSGDDDQPIPTFVLLKRLLTNPIIITVALVEFCTGVLRNGVMHWFPIYAKEVWVLPGDHILRYGSWDQLWLLGLMFCLSAGLGWVAFRSFGKRKGILISLSALAFLLPFLQGGWGGILFVAGVIGGNVAGWASDLLFQSRRAPSAAGLYALLAICTIGMVFTLSPPTNEVNWTSEKTGLLKGDKIVSIAWKDVKGWDEIGPAVACWKPTCAESRWDEKKCVCSTSKKVKEMTEAKPFQHGTYGTIPAKVERDGKVIHLNIPDPLPIQRAGDRRTIKAGPVLPLSPFFLGALVFVMSLCVIGTHGLLSGTATMDFGGRKGAATTVGIIDGFVYLGTAVQSVSLGYLTTQNWTYWPLFLIPFAIIGFLLLTRIWNAKPKAKGAH